MIYVFARKTIFVHVFEQETRLSATTAVGFCCASPSRARTHQNQLCRVTTACRLWTGRAEIGPAFTSGTTIQSQKQSPVTYGSEEDPIVSRRTAHLFCSNAVMTDSSDVTTGEHSVGDEVEVRRPSGEVARGTVVDDFGTPEFAEEDLGRVWAPPHRWAIALDDGRLVFAHDRDVGAATVQRKPQS
jgi:hypothetical protein